MSRKTKRIVVIADPHCGHRVGMTPPQWQLNPENEYDAKWAKLQSDQWNWYRKKLSGLRPIDGLVVLGDAVDGASSKAAGRDSIRQQRIHQQEMAAEVILLAKAKRIWMVYGTRYHVGDGEDGVAAMVGASLGAHEWVDVNGVVFDCKHKVGSSSVPYARMTAPQKAAMWNELWATSGRQPRGDVIVRGHVHYYTFSRQYRGTRPVDAVTCPALQGVGTEFGAEQCEGLVDFGFLHWDITPAGSRTCHEHLAVLESQRAKVSMC